MAKTIVICSSASFYKHVNEIAEQLEQLGYKAVVPLTARKWKKTGQYDVKGLKSWINRPEDFKLKHDLAVAHFNEVAKGDAVLIVNDDKPNQPSYIGPNTTMEWGVAYHLGKPVYILNPVSRDSNFYEEVYGMAKVINGDLTRIEL